MKLGAGLILLGPYVLLLALFFTAPLALMLAISVSRQSFGEMEWTFTLHHYARFFSDGFYLGVLLWVVGYRGKDRKRVLARVEQLGPDVAFHHLKTIREVGRFRDGVVRRSDP